MRADGTTTEAFKATQLKRLDGVATILARTAARDTSLLALIADDSELSESGRRLRRELLESAGVEVGSRGGRAGPASRRPRRPSARSCPRSVISRQLANPFLAPDLSAARPAEVRPQRLAGWELLGPLLRSFEDAGSGAISCMPLPEPSAARVPDGPGADGPPGAGGRGRRGGSPHLPARRRARPGQDRAGAARRPGRRRLPAARGGPERRQDELGPRGRPLDTASLGNRHPRRRRHDRRVRRHRHRQLRGPRPPRRLAGRPRLPRHGRRRGALHQEQGLAALPARAGDLPADPQPDRPPAAHGADRHAADQRPRGLPGDLGVPRLDRRDQAAAAS